MVFLFSADAKLLLSALEANPTLKVTLQDSVGKISFSSICLFLSFFLSMTHSFSSCLFKTFYKSFLFLLHSFILSCCKLFISFKQLRQCSLRQRSLNAEMVVFTRNRNKNTGKTIRKNKIRLLEFIPYNECEFLLLIIRLTKVSLSLDQKLM